MRIVIFPLLVALFYAMPAAAAGDNTMITKRSGSDFRITVDRFADVLKKKGITEFARIDHSALAAKDGLVLRNTLVFVFGNPKLGTPLMQSNQQTGIDLPLKVLVWDDEKGQTWVGYHAPQEIAARHAISDRTAIIEKMDGVLDGLTSAAVNP